MAMLMASGMKTCKGCGNPFTPQNKEDFCFKCRNSSSGKEAEIMDYLRANPGVSILEVSRTTRLPKRTLLNMARSGVFAGLTLNKDFGYPCRNCGKLITDGTYCPECFAVLKKEVKNAGSMIQMKTKVSRTAGMTDDELLEMFYGKGNRGPKEDKSRTFSDGMQNEIESRRKKGGKK